MEVGVKIGGRFWWEVKSPRGDRRGPPAGVRNLVTNVALDEILPSSREQFRYLHVGRGSTSFSNSDTRLSDWAASTAVNSVAWFNGTENLRYAFAKRGEWRFPLGGVVGNIGELGLCHSSSQADMTTLALIRDEEGEPTTITILSDEQLVVTYQIEFYADTNIKESTIQFTGSVGENLPPHTIKVCPMQLWTSSSNDGWYAVPPLTSDIAINLMTNAGRGTTSLNFASFSTSVQPASAFGDIRKTPPTEDVSIMTSGGGDYGSFFYERVVGQRKYLHRWEIPQNWIDAEKEFNMLYWKMGFGKFQVFIDPPITVAPDNRMTLDMHFSWDRYEDPEDED